MQLAFISVVVDDDDDDDDAAADNNGNALIGMESLANCALRSVVIK